jgi:hypothetical protein
MTKLELHDHWPQIHKVDLGAVVFFESKQRTLLGWQAMPMLEQASSAFSSRLQVTQPSVQDVQDLLLSP